MQSACQSTKFLTEANRVFSVSCSSEKGLPILAVCKALRFGRLRPVCAIAVAGRVYALEQAENLDRDVIRSAAFPRQGDECATCLLRRPILHRVKNLGVPH
jgi:hypothetical protein